MHIGKFRTQLLVLFLFVVLCAFSIARFLSQIGLTPDATGYITAAQNFIRTGHMFSFANSPSWTLLPAIEPYTEQPPGFPLFLVPFLLIFKQPVVAAAVAQSFAILFFYSSVYVITRDFGAGPFFQAFCAIVITLFRSMQYVFANVESETLFIALSLWTIHFLVASKFNQKSQLYWIAALLFAAAASLTRAVGILMIGPFLIISWWRGKSRWASIGLSILAVAGPMIAWSLRNQILYGSLSLTHGVNDHLLWGKVYKEFLFILGSISNNPFIIILIAIFCLVCLVIPFIGPIRSWVGSIHFRFTFSKTYFFTGILSILGLALIVIALITDRMGLDDIPHLLLIRIVIAGLGILVVIVGWLAATNLHEYVKTWQANYDWHRWDSMPMLTFGLLFIAGLSHFVGINVLSLVTPFSDVTDRYLSPSLVFLLLSILAGMQYLIRLLPGRFFPITVYGVAFGIILLSPFFLTTGLPFKVGIHIPPEQELWKEIDALPGIAKASHYYSDYNFTHEIFGNRPQRIILDESQIDQPGFLSAILAIGQCPFVIVNRGDKMSQLMDQHYQEANLIRLELLDGQFELFAQPCLLSP